MKQSSKKKQAKKVQSNQVLNKKENKEKEQVTFSPKVEKIYKLILRAMSWIVGVALILVIALFYFDSPAVDQLSQFIFYIGIVTLVIFIVIELVGYKFKLTLSKLIKE